MRSATRPDSEGDNHTTRAEVPPRPPKRKLELRDAYDNPVLFYETLDGAQIVVDDLETLIGFGELQHMIRELSGWFGVESLAQLVRRASEQLERAGRDLEVWSRSAKYVEEYRRVLRLVDALREVKRTLAAIEDGFGLSV
ncbi:MAG TPA: hypothetical protein VN253_03890 [Kofleriaceae bacterium]|nr:hypothetical protein [Kofleriaceae bacterium]